MVGFSDSHSSEYLRHVTLKLVCNVWTNCDVSLYILPLFYCMQCYAFCFVVGVLEMLCSQSLLNGLEGCGY